MARELIESGRYKLVTDEKAGGATFTPKILSDFVADQIVKNTNLRKGRNTTAISRYLYLHGPIATSGRVKSGMGE